MAQAQSLPDDVLARYVASILRAGGARDDDASTVAADLVLADKMGIASHGVTRTVPYVEAMETGRIDPHGEIAVVRRRPAGALVDGGSRFGQVVGRFALDVAADLAADAGAAVVVVRNSYHVGRVGMLGELAAERGLLAIALVAVGTPGPVAPFGGVEGRLGTNPIAYGVPTDTGAVVADFATAAMPEGAIDMAKQRGVAVPEGVLVDASGAPTTDPRSLRETPGGALLPFGGAWAHRGGALNLMVELFAGTLAGYGPTDADRPSNCLFLLVVDPRAYVGEPGYATLAGRTADFVRSARPAGDRPVQLPGQPEFLAARNSGDHATVEGETLGRLAALANRLGVPTL